MAVGLTAKLKSNALKMAYRKNVRFSHLTAVIIKITVFWDVIHAGWYRRFGEIL
jgi:hypothetical protein